MEDYASIIKARVSCSDMLSHMGVQVNRAGFAVCPFHTEKTASLKVYSPPKSGWYCHACHVGGDVINMAMLWYGVDFRGALDRLNEEFELGLPIGQRLTDQQRAEINAQKRRRQAEQEAYKKRVEAANLACKRAMDAWWMNERTIEQNAPEGPLDDWNDAFCDAVRKRSELEYELDYTEERWEELRGRQYG